MNDHTKIQGLDVDAIEKRLRDGFAFSTFRSVAIELVRSLRQEHAEKLAAEKLAARNAKRSDVFRDEARRLAEDLRRYTLPPEAVTVLAREAVIGYEGLHDATRPYERESDDVAAELNEIASALHELRSRYHLETPDAALVQITKDAGPIATLYATIETQRATIAMLHDEVATAQQATQVALEDAAAVRRAWPDVDTLPRSEVLELLACVVESSDVVELDADERQHTAEGLEALGEWIDAMRKDRDDG